VFDISRHAEIIHYAYYYVAVTYMIDRSIRQRFDTIIIGGGQGGLAVGYYLSRLNQKFVILDAADTVGDSWRRRWDSLRLFTPARYSSLPGLPFPAPGGYYPTKDEMADYLQTYAMHFALPVRPTVRVESLTREHDCYILTSKTEWYAAKNVVVATGWLRRPPVPHFAPRLAPQIIQLSSDTYKNPTQIPNGNVLVVGAGNSGAEIAVELSTAGRRVWLSGRDVGYLPFSLGNPVIWWLLNNVLTTDSLLGRLFKERSTGNRTPLIHLDSKTLQQVGVKRVPRMVEVTSGNPRLEDGSVLPVDAVVWATGFRPDYRWIQLSIFDSNGYPRHDRGVAEAEPGLYFIGLPFQQSFASLLIGGVTADAHYIAEQLCVRMG
jgi:putative flavoprotein involved in K+ transport